MKDMTPSEIIKELTQELTLTQDTLQLLLKFVNIDKLETSDDVKAILKDKIAQLNK